jgi:thymidylate kinase
MSGQDLGLAAALTDRTRARNSIPDTRRADEQRRALACVQDELADLLGPGGVAGSPLGVGWAAELVAHVRDVGEAERRIGARWLPLDPVLTRLGAKAAHRWAVMDGPDVLVGVRLVDRPAQDPVRIVIEGCVRRGEVRLRDVLELRELHRSGQPLPQANRVVAAAADVETELGERQLAAFATGRPKLPPVALAPPRRRRSRVVLAVSGVDGAGKSTLTQLVGEALDRAGVPVTSVWVRPGMRLGWVEPLVVVAKRLLRQERAHGVAVVASPVANGLRSRRGAVGWLWSMFVTLAYLVEVRREHRRTHGVVLYDRHLLDAIATLDFAYEGADLRLQRALIRRLLPRADVSCYLEVPAEVAVARKPGDVIGESAVRRQLEVYDACRADLPRLLVLDATAAPSRLAMELLRRLTGGTGP